jgi:hypothetical protein
LFGALPGAGTAADDQLESLRLTPPVFMPSRLGKLIELGREPTYADVDLTTNVGGLPSIAPLFVSAFGSTTVASADLGLAVSVQSARLGIPMVVGENVAPVNGHRGRRSEAATLSERIGAYAAALSGDHGGVVVQQSTEDANAEVWNAVYSDPAVEPLLESGRLAFELKIGQGAKPGLGGMTLVDPAAGERLASCYALDPIYPDALLRASAPGTFTAEILRHQVRLMRNNYPRCRIWVKLFPGRDVHEAAAVAWDAGADAVTVDGAEGGTGWAPVSFLGHVGLPLHECLARIGRPVGCLLASGRMWEGTRAAKAFALGATAVGLGRAALLAVDEDHDHGLVRLVRCIGMELRLLLSAFGKYRPCELGGDDVWMPGIVPSPTGEPTEPSAPTVARTVGPQVGATPQVSDAQAP